MRWLLLRSARVMKRVDPTVQARYKGESMAKTAAGALMVFLERAAIWARAGPYRAASRVLDSFLAPISHAVSRFPPRKPSIHSKLQIRGPNPAIKDPAPTMKAPRLTRKSI